MRRKWHRLLAALIRIFLCISICVSGCGSRQSETSSASGYSAQVEDSSKLGFPAETVSPNAETESSEASETAGPHEGSATSEDSAGISEDGTYFSAEEVSLYLYTYHHLPSNYITKKEARALGWEGGPLEPYAPGKAIGGDVFGNYEGALPEDHTYHECDIDTEGKSRGAKRLVWSEDWTIYYTEDHYETFIQLYP